ncbi:N-acetylmuramoyl-L-alanine amidase [Bacteroidia bacterium]|nr:N-acetylmuramoyl-L-alanine amidase [Bacteroidia bacterium]GHV70839.1 N-acetylmuramoyl-L-alanine amidase [Bacteroidia bacterium]
MGIHSQAQKKASSYIEYIKQYNGIAVKAMDKYKIPASITLAQALLESGAGQSSFVVDSKNHFGIKCHSDWTGKRIYRKDDGPNDCFRKYDSVEDSYEDHAKFLQKYPRYAVLFTYNVRDYTAWAKGLQTCGYATDKAYANKLIRIIELYELYEYDAKSKVSSRERPRTQKEIQAAPPKKRPTFLSSGLLYVLAENNDSFESIAYDMGFKKKNIIKYNEVPEDFPLKKGDIVYLEKKKKKADKPHFEHLVKIGESMHGISQLYGIQVKRLYKLNKKAPDYVPTEGDVLRLR